MKKSCGSIMLVIAAIVFSLVLSSTQGVAAEGTCYLKAGRTDVYIQVLDLDRRGNQGGMIWQGRINANESVKITAPHGRFRYYYNAQPDENQPLSGGVNRWCSRNDTVLVP